MCPVLGNSMKRLQTCKTKKTIYRDAAIIARTPAMCTQMGFLVHCPYSPLPQPVLLPPSSMQHLCVITTTVYTAKEHRLWLFKTATAAPSQARGSCCKGISNTRSFSPFECADSTLFPILPSLKQRTGAEPQSHLYSNSLQE